MAFAQNTLSETKIRNLHPKRDDKHPTPFHMGVPPGVNAPASPSNR